MLKFVIGLTDITDYNGFIYDNVKMNSLDVHYNIAKPSTEIEKATIEWEINTELDAVKHVIGIWETIIRKPHLCMIGLRATPYNLYPDFKEYHSSISFLNLLPMADGLSVTFTDSDYDHVCAEPKFGDLCISITEGIFEIDPYRSNIVTAFYENDIKLLSDASVRGVVMPNFFTDFLLRGNKIPHRWNLNSDFVKFVNDNKEIIESKGYIVDSNRIMNYGSLVIGNLLTDPSLAYNSISKYTRICRTSFVQVNE